MLKNKTHNILEIMRLTINSVYELGLSTNDCSWNNLKLELDINSNVMQIVNLYRKSFKDVIIYGIQIFIKEKMLILKLPICNLT